MIGPQWITDDPTESGWYAVLICYDAEEGFSPSARYWKTEWQSHSPVMCRLSQVFTTDEEATDAAYANDPDVEEADDRDA